MQGRLSKPQNDKIQSFPIKNWEQEFKLASEIGFSFIEWVIDSMEIEINPLLSVVKRKKIKKLSEEYNLSIPAVCHDQLIDIPLHSKDDSTSKSAISIMHDTMNACESLGIQFIEIPLVGNGSLSDNADIEKFIKQISSLDKKAKEFGIHFILETDLPPEDNVKLMKNMNGLSVGLNFDMGNSAYWGFDPDYELPLIGPWIKNVHVKDCTPEDYTISLGNGNVDFKKVFTHLKNLRYDGIFILQAAPAPPGREKDISIQYCRFTQKQIDQYFYES